MLARDCPTWPTVSGWARARRDFWKGHTIGILRLMVGEYALLKDVGTTPVQLRWAAPSVLEALNFLASQGLVDREDEIVSISPRGRRLLALPVLNQTIYTVAFDRHALDQTERGVQPEGENP